MKIQPGNRLEGDSDNISNEFKMQSPVSFVMIPGIFNLWKSYIITISNAVGYQ